MKTASQLGGGMFWVNPCLSSSLSPTATSQKRGREVCARVTRAKHALGARWVRAKRAPAARETRLSTCETREKLT